MKKLQIATITNMILGCACLTLGYWCIEKGSQLTVVFLVLGAVFLMMTGRYATLYFEGGD